MFSNFEILVFYVIYKCYQHSMSVSHMALSGYGTRILWYILKLNHSQLIYLGYLIYIYIYIYTHECVCVCVNWNTERLISIRFSVEINNQTSNQKKSVPYFSFFFFFFRCSYKKVCRSELEARHFLQRYDPMIFEVLSYVYTNNRPTKLSGLLPCEN